MTNSRTQSIGTGGNASSTRQTASSADFGWIAGVGIVARRMTVRQFWWRRHWGWLVHPVRAAKFDPAISWRRLSVGLATTAVALAGLMAATYLSATTGQANLATAVTGRIVTQVPDGSTEASDESAVTSDQIDNYRVAADQPEIIEISKIGIRARIKQMGLNSDKSIMAPTNIHDAGWYVNSAKPGEATPSNKAMFIDGHDVGRVSRGIFYRLNELTAGDEIIIEKGDGTRLTYRVKRTETVALDQIDMNKVLTSVTPGKAGLNLMTCDGAVVTRDGKVTQSHRLVVYAELE